MAKETVSIEGLAQMEKAFRDLAPAIQGKKGYPKNILRNAARAMANNAKDKAKSLAPVDSGRLREAIHIKLLSTKYRDQATMRGDSKEYYYLGHKAGWDKDDPKGAYYGSMVETGHMSYGPVRAKKAATSGTWIPAKPHLRPAVESNRGALIRVFTDKFSNDITKTAAKVARKNRANESWKYTGRTGRVI